jgi:hypothetical protein
VVSVVEALPTTGRYHQIRKHFKFIGHPIVGDKRYGVKANGRGEEKGRDRAPTAAADDDDENDEDADDDAYDTASDDVDDDFNASDAVSFSTTSISSIGAIEGEPMQTMQSKQPPNPRPNPSMQPMMLWSVAVSFPHPITNQMINVRLPSIPIPLATIIDSKT